MSHRPTSCSSRPSRPCPALPRIATADPTGNPSPLPPAAGVSRHELTRCLEVASGTPSAIAKKRTWIDRGSAASVNRQSAGRQHAPAPGSGTLHDDGPGPLPCPSREGFASYSKPLKNKGNSGLIPVPCPMSRMSNPRIRGSGDHSPDHLVTQGTKSKADYSLFTLSPGGTVSEVTKHFRPIPLFTSSPGGKAPEVTRYVCPIPLFTLSLKFGGDQGRCVGRAIAEGGWPCVGSDSYP